MKILIRADSGNHIGIGHIMRCMTLAKGLKYHGMDIKFITRKHHGHISHLVEDKFQVEYLENGVRDACEIVDGDYQSWLGVSQLEDACDTNNIIKKNGGCDLLIVDHYSLDAGYEEIINSKKILVIDDLMNRNHYCDYLLDQNLSADENQYKKLSLKNETKLFLGPKYALLKEDFRKLRPSKFREIKSVNNILVFFGGSDITRESRKVLEAYLNKASAVNIKIILNQKHEDYEYIRNVSLKNNKIMLVDFEKNMAQAIKEADVCFGAAGTSSWERACLGVPSFVVTIADNQKLLAKLLGSLSYAIVLGDGKNTSTDDWEKVFDQFDDMTKLNYVAEKSFIMCDGDGTCRLIQRIMNVRL